MIRTVNPAILTGASVLAAMYAIHRMQGKKIALPDYVGLAGGTALAYWLWSR